MLAYIKLEYWLTDEQEKEEFREFLIQNGKDLNESLSNSSSLREMIKDSN